MIRQSRAGWLKSQERWHATRFIEVQRGNQPDWRAIDWRLSQCNWFATQLSALSVKGK